MRKFLVSVALLAVVGAACAPEESDTTAPGGTSTDTSSPTADPCAVESLSLYEDGSLTIATGNPAYAPWYGGKSTEGSEWESSDFTGDPYTGEGYEAAFAYALAEQMGFVADDVQWVAIPFNKSFAPGPKEFDLAMQQISITEKRAGAVDFSEGYFDVNQALIANEGSPAIGVTTLEGLKDLKLGAPEGTTSLQVIDELVQPTDDPAVYPDLDLALKDLKNGQIDGVVVDFPTAFYGYADVVVGQFPDLGEQEQFGLTFEKGSALTPCVDAAIQALSEDGTLDALKAEWLEVDTSVPTFS
ncbi:MAG: ABC transporter substrate-binding protein [Actinomycetota bacterium]